MSPVRWLLGTSTAANSLWQYLEVTDFGRLSGGRKCGNESDVSLFHTDVTGDWHSQFYDTTLDRYVAVARPALERYGYLWPRGGQSVFAPGLEQGQRAKALPLRH